MLPGVLDQLDLPPARTVTGELAAELARRPAEWARYYRSYQVETWDRDLAMSCWVHAGTDQRMLYLEWTHCILTPLRSSYRAVDRAAPAGSGPVHRTALDLVLLPMSVARRARSVIRNIRILETTLFRAVGQYLEDRGYSVVEFQKVASATINHNTVAVNGGTFVGSTVGAGAVEGGGSTRVGSVRAA